MWMDGLERRAMATYRNHPASGSCARRRAWSTLERSAQSLGGSAVDYADRRTMARPATTVWAIPDGASTLPELGARWNHRTGTAGTSRAPQRSGWIGFERMFCGR